jgi:para-nitrobenzyl esterase
MLGRSAVHTDLGEIHGRVHEGYHSFRGIRYAKAPVGARRFAAPVPVDPWDEPIDATAYGASAPQPSQREGNPLPGREIRWDEDCLFLNVFTPAPDDARRPVLFWIHGGAYTAGSGDAYHGGPFATHGDIVVVTVNYRLGVFGFMELGHLDPALAGSQNNGIRDQIAALQWVHDHIQRFGGDPDQITICGESAGAGSVAAILGAPAADHLYHRAIAQSPPVSFAPTTTDTTDRFLERVEGFDRLRSADPADLIDAQVAASTAEMAAREPILLGIPGGGLRPSLDDHTVTRHPIEAVRALGPQAKPLMVGTNSDEGTLFAFYLMHDVDDTQLYTAVAAHCTDPDRVIAAFRAEYPGEDNRRLMRRMLTDTMFRTGALELADAQTDAGGDVFVYLFSWASQGFGGRLGAMHALEIPFVWDGDLDAWSQIMGEGRPWPDDLSARMHHAWIGFIRDGDPSHAGIGEWPRYDTDRRPTMEFGETSQVLEDPGRTLREAWRP